MLGGTCDENLLNDDSDSYSNVERYTFRRRVRKYIKDMFQINWSIGIYR